MNKIPGRQILEEVAAELDIDPAFIEKDWYVTQLIAEMSHFKFIDAQIVFTGGTSLSKAHQIIKRFSEDTDFRIISKKSLRPHILVEFAFKAMAIETIRNDNGRSDKISGVYQIADARHGRKQIQ